MQPLKFSLKSSRFHAALVLFFYLGAIAVLFVLSLPWWMLLVLNALCLISLVFTLYKQVFHLSEKSIIRFWHAADDCWALEDRMGHIHYAKLASDSICTLYFVLLNFRDQARKLHSRISIVILPDSLSKDEFRQLRVCLK